MSLADPQSWTPQGVSALEPNAWDALRECSQSVCITAGAGAGKTEFLAQKAAYLLQTGICRDPKRILAISFKKDAASNLGRRVEDRCPEQARRFTSVTFDAFAKGFVDRFRLAIPAPYTPPSNYRVGFSRAQDLRDFLTRHGFHGINARNLERQIATTLLPLADDKIALKAYWDTQLHDPGGAILTFPMINRMVELLIRQNPYIRRALRRTYDFVFLDEFQDTTYQQFDLIRTAFQESETVLTAVGDRKQCIMGWAGAMNDSFAEFEDQFDAVPFDLLSNWRSHADLVHIHYTIAQRIDPSSELADARSERDVDGDISAIWEYHSSDAEAEGLAGWFAGEIENGIEPHRMAVLVRNHPDQAEERLIDAFSSNGVRLRNVARMIGDIAIQDLLHEAVTEIALPLMRIGSTKKHPTAWGRVDAIMRMLEGLSADDDLGEQRLKRRLEEFIRELRAAMTASEPSENTSRQICQMIKDFITLPKLRSMSPSYRRQQDFNRVWDGLVELLVECAEEQTWPSVLDRFEGVGQMPLMTIHKSKGLEFHTIVFHGLDDQTWWSLTPSEGQELNAFFVAFTRAEQRAFFTSCSQNGRAVNWIESLLASAGVDRIAGP